MKTIKRKFSKKVTPEKVRQREECKSPTFGTPPDDGLVIQEYEVQEGDSLVKIAYKFGVSQASIRQFNQLLTND